MTILNLLWGFTTGGISNCFLIYNRLGEVAPDLTVVSVCVVRPASTGDLQQLYDQNINIIHIKSNYDLSWIREVKKLIKTYHVDCLFSHAHNGPMMLYISRLLRQIRLPLITTIHGYYPAPRKVVELVWMHYLKQEWVKKIIFVDNKTPTIIQSNGVQKEKMVVVHNGIDVKPVYDKHDFTLIKDATTSIVTASRLTEIKGLNYLLDALGILHKRGVDFHYYCVGNGEDEEKLKKQANDIGISQKVTFVGYQRDVTSWLDQCDIYALPSLMEAHSLAILEAMRAKKAIIATNVGGNPESIRDGKDGLLVPSKDSQSLADALQRLIESKDLRLSLGNSAYRRFLEEFTIDKMMNKIAIELLTTKL